MSKVSVKTRDVHPLTERQVEIVELYREGYSYQDIADVLNIAYHTVKNHLRAARTRLNVHTTAQAGLDLNRRRLRAERGVGA